MKSHAGNGLIGQFAILSLIVIGLITIALSLVISYYLRKDLLEREWRFTADYTRAEALHNLAPTDFAAPMTREAQEHFKTFYRRTIVMPEIVRVKIYDATMAVVWSDDPRLIGRRFPDNFEVAGALAGRTTVNLKMERQGENVYEPIDIGHLAEVYVPVAFPGTAGVAGVVETYKRPEQVFANIRRSQLVVAGTALAGGAVLYLSLFWIVRRAARRIETQRALTARLQAVREEERSSIAHEAREELAQVLTALKMDLAWLAAKLPDYLPALRVRTNAILAVLDTAMESALRIAGDSRPDILDALGLAAAIDWEARRFQARTGIRCQFASSFENLDLDREHRTVMFRIIQESLANVARHARATCVTIGLEKQADGLVLTVEDDGRGITDREIADPKSLGLLDMRERALLLGGELLITGAPGKGTSVALTVPFKRAESPTLAAAKAE